MVITIIAGAGEGKSGLAYWIEKQLKTAGVQDVVVHDDSNEEQTGFIQESMDRIVKSTVASRPVHIVTKLKNRKATDQSILSEIAG